MLVTRTSGDGSVGAGDAATARGRISLGDFVPVALQMLLVLVVLRQFQIEGKAFVELAAYTFVGFGVHAFLPLRWRLPFFALLSLGSIAFVLGAANAAWIIAIGGVLIGLCHLPVAPRWRVVLLLAVGALLMAQRSKWLPVPWSEAIWPILGSMFMFRLIVYFYDLTHDKTPVTAAQSVSYFAMLPNVCFALFPVIDFKTYRRSHYARDAAVVYQKGVDWIARGIVHLILYRYVYYYLTLAPSEVGAPADLLQYLVANFMLYLRVSGLFHLIVGIVHLFGFDLPETHNRYLLASSFSDYWRRINIYWRDFMQKVFYLPAVFAFRRFGMRWALVLAVSYVFVLTWFLHSYQWFWLRGSWLLSWQDGLFWAILGLLVVANSLYEASHGRTRSLRPPAWSLRSAAGTIAKTYATFWFICVLWSFWTADSVGAWWSLWSALGGPLTPQVVVFPLLALAIIVLGSIPAETIATARTPERVRRLLWRDRAVTAAMLVALVLVSVEAVHTKFGATIATTVHSLRSAKLSRLDGAKLERGYYEGLMDVGGFNSELWEVYNKRPENWLAVDFTGLKRFTGNFAQNELIPSAVSASQYGTITTNRHGLRDRDYGDARPAGTLRIAVLGSSSVMGWGVGDGQTFEALLEDRLAREPIDTGFAAVELLNYGVPGYQPPQQLVNFERSLQLGPNAIMYIATGREPSRSAEYLAEVLRKRIAIPYPELQAIVAEAGVTPEMDQAAILKKLEPLRGRILKAVYGRLGAQARERGIAPLWVFLPQVEDGPWREETPEALRIAQESGFRILDLDDVFRGHAVESIRLAQWDLHPNAQAHRLLADRLYAELKRGGPALFESAAR
jgi:D-alanyl-lipoteichoic acid acyltransferase DltB (MBOAT superfamily)